MAQIKLLSSLFNRTSVFQSKHIAKASLAFSSASASSRNTGRAKHEINATEKVARKPFYTLFAATWQSRKILNLKSSDRTHFRSLLLSYNQSASPVLTTEEDRRAHPKERLTPRLTGSAGSGEIWLIHFKKGPSLCKHLLWPFPQMNMWNKPENAAFSTLTVKSFNVIVPEHKKLTLYYLPELMSLNEAAWRLWTETCCGRNPSIFLRPFKSP